jgi:1-acyl-sn-glycerol-3-phosphate acyltransferase
MTLVLLPFSAITLFITSMFGRDARERMVMRLTPPVLGALAAAMGLRITIAGRRDPRVKIFVGNHVSYLDILVAGIGVGGVFVSRHDVKDWPVIGLFARLAGTVFLDRRSLRSAIASSADIGERVSRGVRIALFPEGGTTGGLGVGGFRAFLFGSIAGSDTLVQPFTIRYERLGRHPLTRENRDMVYWFDPAPSFPSHGWRLLKLPILHVRLTFQEPVPAPATAEKESLREFGELLRSRVAAGLEPLPSEE